MSHNPETVIDCPNCGYKAQYNYCARCGQATHLHKDTFWGLIVHFVGHYFHYDSKFWNTIKTLWTKPGALTIAYRNKQRMRFIDPISLYIFVSAVFFLVFFSVADKRIDESKNGTVKFSQVEVRMGDGNNIDTVTQTVASGGKSNEGVGERGNGLRSDAAQHAFFKGLLRNIPKAVFFMIPVMAVVLKLFFARRKSLFFVDHGIFSLHFHAFWFSLMLFGLLIPGTVIAGVVANLLMLAGIVYFVLSLKNTYSIGILRALLYSIGIGAVYSLVLLGLLYAGAMYMAYQ